MKTIEDVWNWFGNRGICLRKSEIKKWHWDGRYLFYIVKTGNSNGYIRDTPKGKVSVSWTHREDGSGILGYERLTEIPFADSPFKNKTHLKILNQLEEVLDASRKEQNQRIKNR